MENLLSKKTGFTPLEISRKLSRRTKFLTGFTPLQISRKLSRRTKFLTGFTLLEVIVATLITGLVMGTGVLMLFTGQRVADRGFALMNIQFEARKAMSRMSSELRNTCTGHIYILDSSGNHVLSGNRLRFQLPVDYDGDMDVLDDWGHIEWGETNSKNLDWSTEFTISGTNLVRRVYNGMDSIATQQATYEIILARDVGNIQFIGESFTGSADNLALVEINLETQRTTLKGVTLSSPLIVSLGSKVKFRN